MGMVTWNDTLSVGVQEIDMQHKKLVAMVNDLHDGMKEGKGKEQLEKLLSGLISYTATHFKTEEKYFDKFKYSESISHKKEHTEFIKKVTDFKSKFEMNEATVTIDVMNFLTQWLFKHIKGTDKKYGKFFNEKGLK